MKRLVIAVVFLLTSTSGYTSETEVKHLVASIKQSNCDFLRNGKTYTAEQAAEHILKKYKYYEDDITSAETFIKLAATKSALSGKPYQIDCKGKQLEATSAWLLNELDEYRRKGE